MFILKHNIPAKLFPCLLSFTVSKKDICPHTHVSLRVWEDLYLTGAAQPEQEEQRKVERKQEPGLKEYNLPRTQANTLTAVIENKSAKVSFAHRREKNIVYLSLSPF